MSQLAASQAAFFAGLKPDADAAAQQAAARLLDASDTFAADARLGVYRQMYVLRLTQALRIDFEQVHRAVGEPAFVQMAHDYIVAFPPKAPSLDAVGTDFAAHLDARAYGRCDLADLARLEWSRALAAHDTQRAPRRFDDWLALGPEKSAQTGFVLSPSLRMCETQHPVCALWSALEHDTPIPEPVIEHACAAVWRDGARVVHRPLSKQEAQALVIVQHGGAFTAVCQAFVDAEAPAQQVAACMQQFFAAGFIVGFADAAAPL